MTRDEFVNISVGAHIILSRGGSVIITGIDQDSDRVYCENLYGECVCLDSDTLKNMAKPATPQLLASLVAADA